MSDFPYTATYNVLPNGDIYITGARLEGFAADYIRSMPGYARMSAIEISLHHAAFEADMVCEWTYFVSRLTPDMRVIAQKIGIIE